MDSINLHAHSVYSFLGSLLKVENLVGFAAFTGFKGCCLTDTLSTFGFSTLARCCEREMLKPVYGLELFTKGVHGRGQYPLIVIAINNQGLSNIHRLNTLSHGSARKTGSYSLPLALIAEHSNGLAVLAEGELFSHFRSRGLPDEGLTHIINQYQELFGDRFYLEMNYTGDRKVAYLKAMAVIIENRGLRGISTLEARHYPEDAELFSVLDHVREREAEGRELMKPMLCSCEYPLRKPLEMAAIFKNHPDYLNNAARLFDSVDTSLEYPVFQVPFENSGLSDLKKTCMGIIKKKQLGIEYRRRLLYELSGIEYSDLLEYFLFLDDLASFARKNRITVRPSSGRLAASLIAWLLGLTDTDPVRSNLPFEIFIIPGVKNLPSADLETPVRRKSKLNSFLETRYGQDSVFRGMVLERISSRPLLKFMAEKKKYKGPELTELWKLLSRTGGRNLTEMVRTNPALAVLCDTSREVRGLVDPVMRLESLPRKAVVDQDTVLIIPGGADGRFSGRESPEGLKALELKADDLIDSPLLHFRLRGSRIMGIIDEAAYQSGQKKLPEDDEATYSLICGIRTCCIPGLDQPGIKGILKAVRPCNLDELTDCLALYRLSRYGTTGIDAYLEWLTAGRASRIESAAELPYKPARPLLSAEELIGRVRADSGLEWKEAVDLFHALASRDNRQIPALKKRYMDKALAKGMTSRLAEESFAACAGLAPALGWKCEMAGQALWAYRSAYYKEHNTAVYFTAFINHHAGDLPALNSALTDMRAYSAAGLSVAPPDINKSGAHFSSSGGFIRAGLLFVRFCTAAFIKELIKDRRDNGIYNSLLDFCIRMKDKGLNYKIAENLVKAGAFDFTAVGRNRLLAALPQIQKTVARVVRERQEALFSAGDEIPDMAYFLKHAPEYPEGGFKNDYQLEYESTGLFLTHHPLEAYMDRIAGLERDTVSGCTVLPTAVLAGFLHELKARRSRNGGIMLSARLTDETGSIPVFFFPESYARYSAVIRSQGGYLVKGNIKDGCLYPEQVFRLEDLQAL